MNFRACCSPLEGVANITWFCFGFFLAAYEVAQSTESGVYVYLKQNEEKLRIRI